VADEAQDLKGRQDSHGRQNTPQSLNGILCRLVHELVGRGLTLEQGRQEFEKQFILASLRSNAGNLGRAAKSLGVHRNTLRNKATRLGIDFDEHGVRGSGKRRNRRNELPSN
jgi:DNA-binding NtrC family response regulator